MRVLDVHLYFSEFHQKSNQNRFGLKFQVFPYFIFILFLFLFFPVFSKTIDNFQFQPRKCTN